MIEYEKFLISALLLGDTEDDASQIIEPLKLSDFSEEARPYFKAIFALVESGKDVEAIPVKEEMVRQKTFDSIGGAIAFSEYLSYQLEIGSRKNITRWVTGIKEASRRLYLIQETSKLHDLCLDPSIDSKTILGHIQALSVDLDKNNVSGTSFSPIDLRRAASDLIDELCKSHNGIIGIPSGIPKLDEMTGGFRPGQYVSIGARPSVGKSSLGLQIASHAANLGHAVLFFSLEMEPRELALIRACSEAEVSRYVIQHSRGEAPVVRKVFEALQRQSETKLFVEKLFSPSLGPIVSKATRHKAQNNIGLIVLDYLQLCRVENSKANRAEQLTEISAGLKNMASVLEVPIVICAQLNREATKDNEKPKLSHFKESGCVEQDSDVAILLHRVNPEADRLQPIDIDLLVEKNRTGPIGVINTSFIGKHQKFIQKA